MNYLFFDIECANCFEGVGKICEFGYVLTDENLTVLENGIFLINPNAKFDWYVRCKIISYKIREYLASSTYPKVYHAHIKRLLEREDTLCVGHGIKNDVGFLYDECARYALPRLNLRYVDTSLVRKKFYNERQEKSLKKIVKELEIGDPKSLHNSEYDAKMTLEYVKILCRESGLSFAELIDRYSNNKMKRKMWGDNRGKGAKGD